MQGETSPLKIDEYNDALKEKDAIIKQRDEEIKRLKFENLKLQEEYALLIYKRFCKSAEQLLEDKKQRELFSEEETKAENHEEEIIDTQKIKSYSRKRPGRKPLSDNFPREQKIIDIPEEEKMCACGAKMVKIGEEVSEKLVIIEPKIIVEQTVRPKYACRCCEGTEDEDKPVVRIAPPPPRMIPRGIASESLLATIITHKFEDHLPYYRQERQFKNIGVDISRQDMSNWQQQVYEKLLPLFGIMKEIIKSGPVMHQKLRFCGRNNGAGHGGRRQKGHTEKLYVACARRAA